MTETDLLLKRYALYSREEVAGLLAPGDRFRGQAGFGGFKKESVAIVAVAAINCTVLTNRGVFTFDKQHFSVKRRFRMAGNGDHAAQTESRTRRRQNLPQYLKT
jgi:hypothetical protein